ncbi:MAG: hypothetical protein Q7O66_20570, partial [Dehalococcoidia bacterium]|nr:hypothetical protein [Dehalococcoidia bacterium]
GGQATMNNGDSRRDKPRKKGGCCGCGCFFLILILLILAAGGVYGVAGKDLPPRPWETAGEWISTTLGGKVPFIEPLDKPLPKMEPQLEKEAFDAARAALKSKAPAPSPTDQKEAQLRSQIEATKLPITVISIVQTSDGAAVLVVGVKYSELAAAGSSGGGLAEGLTALQRLSDAKTVSLSGLHDVTVAVEDDQGRVLFGVSAPVAAIESYRAGTMTKAELARTVGFQGESRLGVLDSMRKGVTQ